MSEKKYTSAEVFESLERLAEELDGSFLFESLNRGGCCVIASLVALALKEGGYEVEVASPYCKTYKDSAPWGKVRDAILRDAGGNMDYLADAAIKNNVSFGHVWVRVKIDGEVYNWDSHGMSQGPKHDGWRADYPFGKGIPPEEALACAMVAGPWNSEFRRSLIPTLIDLVENWFEALPDWVVCLSEWEGVDTDDYDWDDDDFEDEDS